MNTDTPASGRKAQLDALLLKLPGASARKINGLDAYFVSDKMFACISGDGVGLRLPAATATELHFSRDNVVPFQPGSLASLTSGFKSLNLDASMVSRFMPIVLTFVQNKGGDAVKNILEKALK